MEKARKDLFEQIAPHYRLFDPSRAQVPPRSAESQRRLADAMWYKSLKGKKVK